MSADGPGRTTALETVPPIGFRAETETFSGSLIEALLVTVLLLGVLLALAVVARRRGWLRHLTPAGDAQPSAGGLRIAQRLRLSPRTMLFRVVDGRRAYIVVESSAHASIVVADPQSTEPAQ